MDPDDPVLADHQAREIEFAASTGKNSSSRVRIQIAARELGRFLERPAVTHKLQFAQNSCKFTSLERRRMQVATGML